MGTFYNRLSYSFGNEDWNTEQKALQITPEDRVLCVTASGDRPLNLLSTPCKEMVTIDANPIQNALFDLKAAALKTFDYNDYIAFLGLEPMDKRLEHYKSLKGKLTPHSLELWEKNHLKVRKGVLFEGAIEKMAKVSSTLAQVCRRKKIETLFSFDCIEEQKRFVQNEFDTAAWRRLFTFVHLFRRFSKDPGLYKYVAAEFHTGKFLHERINHYLHTSLAKKSLLMNLILRGKFDHDFLPPYLHEKCIPQIIKQLDSVSFETIDLLSYLEKAPDESFDRFSLSDVASYIPEKAFEKMLTSTIRVAKPGARFCIRQFMTDYEVPKHLKQHLKRDLKLEETLNQEDNCFVYHFMVGEVVK
ncbi:MAG: hypothetical protein S4CHLAM45_13130 [Chlamydiales bacterium]|nr:hypothetical protein [Chlamydiales bacterium]MCH9619802.1 hypothetical protein [Chlamydiales bacterium]MCH9623408.1 hypothetical protein [Chlamydiales bacterium]